MRFSLICGLAALMLAGTVSAEPNSCEYPQELDRYRLLRRLSMDLRLRAPDYAEYTALDGETELPESAIDAYLNSEEFRQAARRFHEDLLWPNVGNVSIAETSAVIAGSKKNGIFSVIGAGRRKMWRKGTGNETCGNWKQEDFNPDGSPIPIAIKDENGKLLYLEDGYVEVTPYWDPSYKIKVCAFDAQTAEVGVKSKCNVLRAKSDPKCGCGHDLRYCYGGGSGPYSHDGAVGIILQAVREQLLMLLDDHTVGADPYSQILTTKKTYMNGALYYWQKYLAGMTNLNKTFNAMDGSSPPMPESPDFTDGAWEAAERLAPHAGLVTLPAFSLRFQTNRGRANRFRVAFTGQYFVPPAEPTDTDCDPAAEDLTQRCTCRKCHQVLEPLAAHFGLVAEAGSSLMTDTEVFPTYNKLCDPTQTQKLPLTCARFYVTSPDSYNPGTLLPYQFADIDDPLHKTLKANLEGGPELWADTIIGSGQFHSAIVRHLFRHLMGRGMLLDPTQPENELALLTDLASQFAIDDNFKAIVKAMVMLPQYRRVR